MSWKIENFARDYIKEIGTVATGNVTIHLNKEKELPLLKDPQDLIKQIEGQASFQPAGSDPIISVLASNLGALEKLLAKAGLFPDPS